MVQQLLHAHNYNSVGNLIRFYEAFRESNERDLFHFYCTYNPTITSEHYTCVGLALELLQRLSDLEDQFPGLTSRLYLASCEESIENEELYMSDEPCRLSVEKEHVLVALKVDIAGRLGVLLLDPGYHVARVVTVMADKFYPHTGWFVQSDEPHCRKEYHYSLSEDSKYVIWQDRRTSAGEMKTMVALIFISCPFLCSVMVTERRNLVYDYRSLIARDTKGHLVAGIYFKILDNHKGDLIKCMNFTAFHQCGGTTRRMKIPFSYYILGSAVEQKVREFVAMCGQQLGLPDGKLEDMLIRLSNIFIDYNFRRQLLDINAKINAVASDN